MKIGFFSIVFAIALAVIAGLLFGLVLPPIAAWFLAAIIGVIELVGASRGQSIRALMRIDFVLLAWPVAAFALDLAGVTSRGLRITAAAGIAALVGAVAAGRGAGQDDSRLRVALVSCVIVGYSLLRALTRDPIDPVAVAAGCIACAVPLLIVSAGGVVLPRRHQMWLRWGAAACTWGGLIAAIPIIKAHIG
ncbi:MAG: hypothetical protein ACYCZI_00470 [Metallibacterium scheffleri]